MDKSSIRNLFIQKRHNISIALQTHASQVICEHIQNLTNYIKAQKIGLYMSVNNEINLNLIWQNAIKQNKKCYFPKVKDNDSMIFLPADNINAFSRNKWGILEPTNNEKYFCPINELDLIIVPLVVFDPHGNRIGMGKGFYDRLLANNHTTTRLGVAYDFQKVPSIKSETWDIKLDIIITEKMVYYV